MTTQPITDHTDAHPGATGHLPVSDGLVAVVSRECPTCRQVEPVLAELLARGVPLVVCAQEDPADWSLLAAAHVVDDAELWCSHELGVETVPTLVRLADGQVVARTEGWWRERWEELTGESALGAGLPPQRPGCGSRTTDPALADELAVRFHGHALHSRRVTIGPLEDEVEALYDRGWSDGLPLVPPTPSRVLRMLEGTTRAPDDIVAVVPPLLAECTVEKVAVNAVMAGCRPEYLPVVLAAVEGACSDEFNAHVVLATTNPFGPIVVVNGPIRHAIGMNSGVNALGQGNRANSTIGRALQLVIRNVGGGRPGEVDRATLGNPGKLGVCFAEDEEGSPWEPLSVFRGVPRGTDAVTLFAGEGPRNVMDQLSRDADSLARSFAACLRTVQHPKHVQTYDAMLVVSPEHAARFRDAGWSRTRLLDELHRLTVMPGEELVRGAGGIEQGLPAEEAVGTIPKFRPDGLHVVQAGGGAGLFSAIIGGFRASEAVTREIRP